MKAAAWPQLLAELEAALSALEQAAPDELEAIAGTAGLNGSFRPDGAIPPALAAQALELQARMARLISELEQRQGAVGSELAAITAPPASDRPVPKFLDTRA